MKNIFAVVLIVMLSGCADAWLNGVDPLTKISDDKILNNAQGPLALLATLYKDLPIDDFNFNPHEAEDLRIFEHGYNYRGNSSGSHQAGFSSSFFTDDAISEAYTFFDGMAPYWRFAYGSIRGVNQFIEVINTSSLSDGAKKMYIAEAAFINAYTYFQLARRYGGVCLISKVQQLTDDLNVPRSTEKETYDYILSQCDAAIADLPLVASANGRATKWAALGLKSRVALHAASICKFQNKTTIDPSYPAVVAQLAGTLAPSDANVYYQACIDASKEIINFSGRSLYMPNPSSPEVATKNYATIFQDPVAASEEVIFAKYYLEGGGGNRTQGHATDFMFVPRQINPSALMSTKFNPTLNLVDVYETYSNDGIRQDGVLQTWEDGDETVEWDNRKLPIDSADRAKFKKYNTTLDIFTNKDARLFASIILPGSEFKSKTIIMQGGMIRPDGKSVILTQASDTLAGTTYYTYGAQTQNFYSGFDPQGGNSSLTGFSLRKFLQEDKTVILTEPWHSTTPFIDMRLAEIYLNYAEAVVESGLGDASLAKTYLNAIRKRAAHKDDIDLTVDNVLKERRVELAFEGSFRFWDLVRRRDFETLFPLDRKKRQILMPIINLADGAPKYIMARTFTRKDENVNYWHPRYYYQFIPGISLATHIIQNPGY